MRCDVDCDVTLTEDVIPLPFTVIDARVPVARNSLTRSSRQVSSSKLTRVVVHEGDEPDALAHLRHADLLPCKHVTEIDRGCMRATPRAARATPQAPRCQARVAVPSLHSRTVLTLANTEAGIPGRAGRWSLSPSILPASKCDFASARSSGSFTMSSAQPRRVDAIPPG